MSNGRQVRILNCWGPTGEVFARLLGHVGFDPILETVRGPTAAVQAAEKTRFELALTAFGMQGSQVIRSLNRLEYPPSCLFMAGSPHAFHHGTKAGARAVLMLPFRGSEALVVAQSLIEWHRLVPPRTFGPDLDELSDDTSSVSALSGGSAAVRTLRAALKVLAQTTNIAWLWGPSVTVRWQSAMLVHAASAQLGRGVYLGPDKAHQVDTAWRRAAYGTLFFDDLERWPLSAQAAIVERLRAPTFDAPRVIFGGTRPVEQTRELHVELFSPLSQSTIRLPSISERRADLAALIEVVLGSTEPRRWLHGQSFVELIRSDLSGINFEMFARLIHKTVMHYPTEIPPGAFPPAAESAR